MPIIDNDNQEIDATAIREHQGAGEHWNSFTRANLISYSQPSFEMEVQGLKDVQDLIAFSELN